MELLRGAIDTHVHSFPDVIPRKLDDLELVEQARAAGMRGLVLKSHVFSTAERAWLLNRLNPDFRVAGGLVLNDPVGGLNPRAVEAALKLGALQVWMPTLSAANHREHLGGSGTLTVLCDGRLRPEVTEILSLLAETDAILATGHLSPHEIEVLIEAALERGVSRINVTHPEWPVTALPIESQRRFAQTGRVFLERCLVATLPGAPARFPLSASSRRFAPRHGSRTSSPAIWACRNSQRPSKGCERSSGDCSKRVSRRTRCAASARRTRPAC